MITHHSTSPQATEQIAADLARTLTGGECIALEGELGAGKTQFVRGLVMGLAGNPRAVSSPTFMLLNIYRQGRLPVFHLDAYRVFGADDFESIGFTELLDQSGVVVVEWASRVTPLLPPRRISVRIVSTGSHNRQIDIEQIVAG
ncbi:MAG: tRNA (adenosine(37)-N6)-threonylcarbamoyltransferase complex ATPase subunit type 1 TsaE [Planctomycetota bacterium]|nr:tRNA (adenosine(37)-N6)-threonylcarbamoyltransferase complex ATPase subunit type 1 TsaE [Planctomycetota bacterium]